MITYVTTSFCEGYGVNDFTCDALVAYDMGILVNIEEEYVRVLKAKGLTDIPPELRFLDKSSTSSSVFKLCKLRSATWRKTNLTKDQSAHVSSVFSKFKLHDMMSETRLRYISDEVAKTVNIKNVVPRAIVRTIGEKGESPHINYPGSFGDLFDDMCKVQSMKDWISLKGVEAVVYTRCGEGGNICIKNLTFNTFKFMLLCMHPKYGFSSIRIDKQQWELVPKGANYFNFSDDEFISTFNQILHNIDAIGNVYIKMWLDALSPDHAKIAHSTERENRFSMRHISLDRMLGSSTRPKVVYWPVGFPCMRAVEKSYSSMITLS